MRSSPRIIKYSHIAADVRPIEQFMPSAFDAPPVESEPEPVEQRVTPEEEAAAHEAVLAQLRVEVELESQRIVAEAEARAATISRDAAARGYADGKREGLAAAQDQEKEHLERLAELARRASIDREAMVRSTEQALAALAVDIAAKVMRHEVATDPSMVLTMVESALEKVVADDWVRIMVNPEDADLVRDRWSELRGAVAFASNWEVAGDERVERGGCIIETRSGAVDSRIETQLAEIVSAFEVGQ
jgi:flagellar assembly protein FliH